MREEKIVTVFGSSRPKAGDAEYEEARELGNLLAKRGFAVCTGGFGGVMEGVSRGAKEGGGKTYGVTAEFFQAPGECLGGHGSAYGDLGRPAV